MPYSFNPFTGSFDNTPTIPLVDSLYLPLSGGTLTGVLSTTDTIYTTDGNSVFWNDAYTNLVSNSAAYLNSGGIVSGDYLPLSGGLMSGPIGFGDVNGGKIYTGYYDSSRSGLSGISLICSVNYDLNWQAGWITSLQQDRVTPMPLYIDSGVGTSLRVWNGNYVGDGTGTEITHNGITFSDTTTQTTAFTGNTLTFDEATKDLTISNGNTVSLSALVDSNGIDTEVRSLTSNWQNTYTTAVSYTHLTLPTNREV